MSRQEMLEDRQLAHNLKPGNRLGEWKVIMKLDEGSFGTVYQVKNIKRSDQFAALKAEPPDIEGGSAIELEILILNLLNSRGEQHHIPQCFHYAKRKNFNYMVVSLLGDNLRTLKAAALRKKFSIGTWSRIGIQVSVRDQGAS